MKFLIDSKSIEHGTIQIHSRSMADPSLFDIEFKYLMAWVWTTLKSNLNFDRKLHRKLTGYEHSCQHQFENQ